MRAKQTGIEPDAADQFGHEARVLPCCHAPARTSAPTEQEFARLLVSNSYVVIDRLSGLLGQFEPDGLPGLLLSHCRPIDRIPVRCNVFDPEGNDIADTQVAV